MSLDIEPIKSRSYTAEQVDRALLVLAINGGNSQKTQDELKAQGLEVPNQTLREWRNHKYPRRYEEIHRRHFAALEDTLVTQYRESAIRKAQLALQAADRLADSLPSLDTRELPKTIQALTTSGAIDTDKLLTLTGRPTAVIQHQDSSAILRKYGGYIDGEAEELTPEPPTTPGQLTSGSERANAHE